MWQVHLHHLYATPRCDDFFALIAGRVVPNKDSKRAASIQKLIHVSALKGSLTGDTLVGKLTKGLGNQGFSHEHALAAMNDGCNTNGATHELLERAAECGDKLICSISLHISHCALPYIS